jgi:hypothetical protein
MAMAERYQPELMDPTTREKSPNPLHNEERYAFWLAASREAYKAAAPYYAPRLHAIAVAPAAATASAEVERVDPRRLMFEQYMEMRRRHRGELALSGPKTNGPGQEMRRRGELALKAVSGPKTNGPGRLSAGYH